MKNTGERPEAAIKPDKEKVADAHVVDQQRAAPRVPDDGRESSDHMRTPHERDESATENANPAEKPAVQKEIIRQARRDIDRGLEDTDCRSQPNTSPHCPPSPATAAGTRKTRP